MAKVRKRFVCQACGSVSSRWQGQCADCAEWNTLVEDTSAVVTPFSARHDLRSGGRAVELVGLDADVVLPPRTGTGIKEFDRALGGGLVDGSARKRTRRNPRHSCATRTVTRVPYRTLVRSLSGRPAAWSAAAGRGDAPTGPNGPRSSMIRAPS